MIESGTGKVGMRVTCADGPGTVTVVRGMDEVLIKLDTGVFTKLDLADCALVGDGDQEKKKKSVKE